jgi:hypothetical protein
MSCRRLIAEFGAVEPPAPIAPVSAFDLIINLNAAKEIGCKFQWQYSPVPTTSSSNPQAPSGPPMDLANMREQDVRHLIAFCHNDARR